MNNNNNDCVTLYEVKTYEFTGQKRVYKTLSGSVIYNYVQITCGTKAYVQNTK